MLLPRITIPCMRSFFGGPGVISLLLLTLTALCVAMPGGGNSSRESGLLLGSMLPFFILHTVTGRTLAQGRGVLPVPIACLGRPQSTVCEHTSLADKAVGVNTHGKRMCSTATAKERPKEGTSVCAEKELDARTLTQLRTTHAAPEACVLKRAAKSER